MDRYLRKLGEEFSHMWSKSGSIVNKQIDGKMVATKINDKYWMYWGGV